MIGLMKIKTLNFRLDCDPEKLFPRSAFEQQLKKFGKYGLWVSVLLLATISCDPEFTPDMEKLAENIRDDKSQSFSSNTSERYEMRMLGVFEDVCRLGYI
jgi:hypothetical protein